MGIPYVIRTCVAALAGVSPAFELAARNLGASPLRAFVRITLPMMRMGIVAGATFCLLLSFINVPVPLFLTTSSTITVQVAIFSYMLSNTDPGVAAIATIQLFIILAASTSGSASATCASSCYDGTRSDVRGRDQWGQRRRGTRRLQR
jgi:putative spermidine/putrescine transport system permease protein